MLSPRDRLIVTIAAAVIILVALISFLVYPQFQRLGVLSAEVASAQQQADAAKMQLQERQGFKDRAVETSAKWLRLENLVPENPDLPSLIIELQDAGFKSGVQVVNVTPAAPAPSDKAAGVTKMVVNLEILGSWTDTVDYMESLMRLDRGVRIDDFGTGVTSNVAAAAKRNAPLHDYALDTHLALETYVIPSAPAPAQ